MSECALEKYVILCAYLMVPTDMGFWCFNILLIDHFTEYFVRERTQAIDNYCQVLQREAISCVHANLVSHTHLENANNELLAFIRDFLSKDHLNNAPYFIQMQPIPRSVDCCENIPQQALLLCYRL